MPPIEDFYKKMEDIWYSHQLTNNGDHTRELAIKLREYLGVPFISLVSNGTLALQLALHAFGIKREVITTPFTYVATAASIVWEGCEAVFVDIDPQTLCIDTEKIERAITPQTQAIMATHVYGYPCDIEKIESIALRHGLKVIYDASHCFGAKYKGKSLSAYGDAATLSFHATKLFHTGEGGGIVCRESDILDRLELIKKFGHVGEDSYIELGINAKLSELHAAMGLCVLPYVDDLIAKRKKRVELYDSLLLGCGIVRPTHQSDLEYNYAYYPVVLPSAKLTSSTIAHLKENGVFPRKYFYPSLNTLSYLSKGRFSSCPVSEDVSTRVLALPLSHSLAEEQIERIAKLVRNVLE